MLTRSSFLIAALLGMSIAGSSASAKDAATFVIHVDAVSVSPKRPGGQGTWDGAREKGGGDCSLFALAGAGVSLLVGAPPSAGSAAGNVLCKASNSEPASNARDVRAPDLELRLQVGNAVYTSPVAWDAYRHDFGYRFSVPLASVPAHGLKLAVIDRDGDRPGDGELLASFRIGRGELESNKLQTLSGESVEKLEWSAAPFLDSTKEAKQIAKAAAGLTGTTVEVLAGQVVEVKASGVVDVTTFGSRTGPEGFAGSKHRSSNIQVAPFDTSPHAGAIALVAADPATASGFHVGRCARFVAPYSGRIIVGVNDDDTGNNGGAFDFSIQALAVDESLWANPGVALPCDTTGTLSRKAIASTLGPLRDRVVACATAHPYRGTVKARIKIAADGNVDSTGVKGGTKPLAQCIKAVIGTAHFPASTKGATVVYPFVFR